MLIEIQVSPYVADVFLHGKSQCIFPKGIMTEQDMYVLLSSQIAPLVNSFFFFFFARVKILRPVAPRLSNQQWRKKSDQVASRSLRFTPTARDSRKGSPRRPCDRWAKTPKMSGSLRPLAYFWANQPSLSHSRRSYGQMSSGVSFHMWEAQEPRARRCDVYEKRTNCI